MKPEDFELVETADRDALVRHPVWKTYRPADRPWILGWGVSPQRLDAELQRFGYCGPDPLFPVLDCDPIPDRPELVVAVRFRVAAGPELPGYLLDPLAFGVFGLQELAFNRALPDFSRRMTERLARELDLPPDRVFPMTYRSQVRGPHGGFLEGEIPAPF